MLVADVLQLHSCKPSAFLSALPLCCVKVFFSVCHHAAPSELFSTQHSYLTSRYLRWATVSCSTSLPPAHSSGGQHIWRLLLWSAVGSAADQRLVPPGNNVPDISDSSLIMAELTLFHTWVHFVLSFFFSWSSSTWSKTRSAPTAFTTSAPPSTTRRQPWWAWLAVACRTHSSSATAITATSPTSSWQVAALAVRLHLCFSA